MNSKAIAIKELSTLLQSKGMDLDDYDELLKKNYGLGLKTWLDTLQENNQLQIIKNLTAVSLLLHNEQ